MSYQRSMPVVLMAAAALGACSMVPFAPFAPTPKAGDDATTPVTIAVPAGQQHFLTLNASGTQNYECRKADAGYGWVFTGPEAMLYGPSKQVVGKHYAGPTWEYSDGSKVIGKVLADAPSGNTGSIPQLLLMAASSSGPGMLVGVSYVQRVHTSEGAPPADRCDAGSEGVKRKVRYTADYVFYKPR